MHRGHLTQQDRIRIYCLINDGHRPAEIARQTRRRSAVTRELARNSVAGEYQFGIAQGKAEARRYGKNAKVDEPLMFEVIDLLCEDLSPGQISMALRRRGRKLSFQTIYNHIHPDRGPRRQALAAAALQGDRPFEPAGRELIIGVRLEVHSSVTNRIDFTTSR